MSSDDIASVNLKLASHIEKSDKKFEELMFTMEENSSKLNMIMDLITKIGTAHTVEDKNIVSTTHNTSTSSSKIPISAEVDILLPTKKDDDHDEDYHSVSSIAPASDPIHGHDSQDNDTDESDSETDEMKFQHQRKMRKYTKDYIYSAKDTKRMYTFLHEHGYIQHEIKYDEYVDNILRYQIVPNFQYDGEFLGQRIQT